MEHEHTGGEPSRHAPEFTSFRELYDFDFDPFQVAACAALTEGQGVLVAAPTGSGKTVVGEYAVHLALSKRKKCFYTTPIKALSNQKYNDLVRRYDADTVGLLTGDNAVNGDAPVVVMTTEVLRNMLYAGSRALKDLGYVVLDEVHYLADRSRGAVWEEVIIHLPESVRVVALSATVSNAEEFGEWLAQVRGGTDGHRRRAPPGPAVAAHARRAAAVRPVHRRRPPRGQPRTWSGWRTARRSASRPAGRAAAASAPGATRRRTARRSSTGSTRRACCPRSRSSSAGRAATPPSSSAWPRACA